MRMRILKKVVNKFFGSIFQYRGFEDKIIYYFRKNRRLMKRIKNPNVILGSGGIGQKGFDCTDKDTLDVTKESDWETQFNPESISCIFAEHLFEHFTTNEIENALRHCYRYLQKGGRIRIAIPDKNRRDGTYVDEVKPPRDGHKSYLNHHELEKLLKNAGFKVAKLEYYDDNGKFIHNPWDNKYGRVRRSYKYDKQVKFKIGDHNYTSLIVDGIKE
jgi:predicted SAM-dependent methyltransferase